MIIKKRDMKRTNWQRCLEKEYLSKNIIINNRNSVISLMLINKVVEPLVINYEFKKTTIANDNYKWLQIALEDENFWITVMYDDNNNLVQIYFDITFGNCFENTMNPYFYDLFLDIVVTNDKKIYVLDDNELNQALIERVITQKEYELANHTKNKLVDYLEKSIDELVAFCNSNFNEFMGKQKGIN